MRGKKSDPEFISQFIQISVKAGHETPAAIAKYAQEQIDNIDNEIRAVEAKKLVRSKLLDVIASFEAPNKDKTEEAKLLPFFSLECSHLCKSLCDMVKKQPVYCAQPDAPHDFKFCCKQLLEAKIVARQGDNLVQGERFDEYMKFVLREAE